jgi:hypothetical protein
MFKSLSKRHSLCLRSLPAKLLCRWQLPFLSSLRLKFGVEISLIRLDLAATPSSIFRFRRHRQSSSKFRRLSTSTAGVFEACVGRASPLDASMTPAFWTCPSGWLFIAFASAPNVVALSPTVCCFLDILSFIKQKPGPSL